MDKKELDKLCNEISMMLSGKQKHHRGKEDGLILWKIILEDDAPLRFRSSKNKDKKIEELVKEGKHFKTRKERYCCQIIDEDIKGWYSDYPVEDMPFDRFEKYIKSHLN